MRFTIRHLLWFTLLAAVGCWWWMPSADDAKNVANLPPASPPNEAFKRFESLPSLQGTEFASFVVFDDFDFEQHDAVIVRFEDGPSPFTQPIVRTRGNSKSIFVTPAKYQGNGFSVVAVAKRSWIYKVTSNQFYLIDGGMAAGLLTLAIGSLFVGRRRIPLQ